MRYPLPLLLISCLMLGSMLVVGCGKGSSSSSTDNPSGPVTNTTVTVSGNVTCPLLHETFASVRGAATSTVNYGRFTVAMTDGVATSTSVTPGTSTGDFAVTLPSITNSILTVTARHDSGKIILKYRVLGVTPGQSFSGKVVSTVTTAKALMMEANGLLTESSFDNPSTQITMNTLLQVLNDYVANGSAASPTALLDEPRIPGIVSTIANDAVQVVTNAYASMSTLFTNNSQSGATRTSAFMAYIAPDFVDMAGVAARPELESSTASRFDRYDIQQYSFVMKSFSMNAQGTVLSVPTQISVNITKKPGAQGAVEAFEGRVLDLANNDPTLIWTKQTDGTWKISGGLPFRTSEVSF